MKTEFSVRKARGDDSLHIVDLLAIYARKSLLLPRTMEDISSRIDNFIVAQGGDEKIIGCCALRDYGNGLYEIRSLAVHGDFMNRGIGSELIRFSMEKIPAEGSLTKVFALTYRSELFIRLGFRKVQKEMFPEKIWADCSICKKKDNCDEEAVLIEL